MTNDVPPTLANIPRPVPSMATEDNTQIAKSIPHSVPRIPENVASYIKNLRAMTKEELIKHHLNYMGQNGQFKIASKEKHRRGVEAKKQKDPKQLAKSKVRKIWESWNAGEQTFASDAAFSRAMNQKYSILEDLQNIARWSRAWRKEAKQRRG